MADSRIGEPPVEQRMSSPPPIVFISYTQETDVHNARVLSLAQRLRSEGIDCRIDKFVAGTPSEGWPLWMERQVKEANFVLIICTATYLRRYDAHEVSGKGLGGTWEALLIRQDLYEGQGLNRKFIPVCLDVSRVEDIPKPLRPVTRYTLDDGYEALYRHLTDQPAVVAAPLGVKRVLPPNPT
jgi:hypothetical protein